MSVLRQDNICTITFEDDNWKDAAPDVYSVTDGAVTFYSSNTFLYNKKNTLRSGSIGNSEVSEITINVKYLFDGYINFAYGVSSEANCDFIRVIIDGTEVVSAAGGVVVLKEYEQEISAGEHSINIRYTKDGSRARGYDAGCIGYLKFTGVNAPFTRKILLASEGKIYTLVDNELSLIEDLKEEDLNTKEVFNIYGFDELPSSDVLVNLNKPIIYRWTDKDVTVMEANAKAIPKPQTIKCVADLDHDTILGISSITAVYSGNVNISYSYDDVTYFDKCSLEEFLNIDVDELFNKAINKKIFLKFILEDKTSSLTNFIITYKNE